MTLAVNTAGTHLTTVSTFEFCDDAGTPQPSQEEEWEAWRLIRDLHGHGALVNCAARSVPDMSMAASTHHLHAVHSVAV